MAIKLILAFALFIQVQLNARDSTIVFRQIKYSEIFDHAKREKKPVFIYFHFDGCGGCLQMEKTALIKKDIVDFFNKNFVCYSVNISEPEGAEVNKIYDIRDFPTFLFLNSDRKILKEIVGIRTPDQFIQEARRVLSLIG